MGTPGKAASAGAAAPYQDSPATGWYTPVVERSRTWVVALGVNGEVLGAERGAPPEWVGARLDQLAGVPASLRDAARAVVAAVRGSGTLARAVVEVAELGATVELCAVPAVGLHRTPTDVRALLRTSLAALERQARALDVELGVKVDAEVPQALTLDPEKIAWAVSALVGNAMRYVRRGTRQMPGGSVAVRVRVQGGALVVVVEDDGPGIPAEIEKRMFQRAPGAAHATGLALTVVRDIVTAHGGSMELATATDLVEHGTTVTVRVPIA
jgi:signal transduction histidine kinase